MYKYKKIRVNRAQTKDEHVLIWESHNGPIPQGAIVHHVNENKLDNRIDNLQLFCSKAAHTRHHNPNGPWNNMSDEAKRKWKIQHDIIMFSKRREDSHGLLRCSICKQYLPKDNYHIDTHSIDGCYSRCKNCRNHSRRVSQQQTTRLGTER